MVDVGLLRRWEDEQYEPALRRPVGPSNSVHPLRKQLDLEHPPGWQPGLVSIVEASGEAGDVSSTRWKSAGAQLTGTNRGDMLLVEGVGSAAPGLGPSACQLGTAGMAVFQRIGHEGK